MKRIVAVLLTLAICISLCSCGASSAPEINIVTVEITIDNWTDYFEVGKVTSSEKNAFDEYSNVWFGYGIFLKDEYVNSLLDTKEYPMDVVFEVQYDSVLSNARVKAENDGSFRIFKGSSITTQENAIISVIDNRKDINGSPMDKSGIERDMSGMFRDCFDNTVAAGLICPEGKVEDNPVYRRFYENPQVIRAKGTLSYYE